MGTWGTSLYANDTTCDIKADYKDLLRQGKNNKEVTQELMRRNGIPSTDPAEDALFWFALADTQWHYGRLMDSVKEKAMEYLENADNLSFEFKDTKMNLQWKQTLNKLKQQLLTEMPPPKKVSKYRLYQCPWQIGDVFAYRFDGTYSREKGFGGQYIVFRKISENTWWPGHHIPVVQVYKRIWDKIPCIAELSNTQLLELGSHPISHQLHPNLQKQYEISLICTSAQVIPYEQLTYLGNMASNIVPASPQLDYYFKATAVGWEGKGWNDNFESYLIDLYFAWTCSTD